MRPSENRWWELFCSFRGFEDDGTTPQFQSGATSSGEDAGESGEEATDESGSTEDAGSGSDGESDTSGLRSALAKERKDRKTFERELKVLRKEKEDREAAEGTELEKATKKAELAEQRTAQLATKFKTSAVTTAILEAARALKFRDPTDALTTSIREAVKLEQDDDDPAEIEIDETSVKDAVKKLATSKPYLLVAEGDPDPTGSKFGGKGGNKKQATEDELRKKYPAL